MDDHLDNVDFGDILQHGNPESWKFKKEKQGSGSSAHSPLAPAGTLKKYLVYEDEFGREIEVHYFLHADGSTSNVTVFS